MEPSCCGCMKGRAFAAVVLSVLLLLLGLGVGGWWLLWQRGPLQLAHHPLTMPRAARFVPASASLSLYLFSDGEQPVDYARAVAPARQRRHAGEAIARLRDGAFAGAGLDYDGELAGWLGSDIAVALFEDPVAAATGETVSAPARGWLLALSSRDDDGARRFLQRFWQTRSLAGTDLQVSRYRGMGLISGRGALLGSRSVPLATALVEDNLVLIASGRNLLERALDVSQIDSLNQAGQAPLQQALAAYPTGAALLVARGEALQNWLGLPAAGLGANSNASLLAVLEPRGRDLNLAARLLLAESPRLEPLDPQRVEELLPALWGSPTSLALLQDPAALGQLPLLQPLLQRSLGLQPARPDLGEPSLPELLGRSVSGLLLATDGPRGWLLASEAGDPDPQRFEPLLSGAGLLQAPLRVEDRSLEVWTRLSPPQKGARRPTGTSGEQLQAPLVGWRQERGGQLWWGQNLAQLQEQGPGRSLQPLQLRLQGLAASSAPLQWSLDAQGTRALLRSWQPWRLLSALAGGGLDAPLQGLALAVQSPTDQPAVELRAQLQLGS
jgi:hypothetical protein